MKDNMSVLAQDVMYRRTRVDPATQSIYMVLWWSVEEAYVKEDRTVAVIKELVCLPLAAAPVNPAHIIVRRNQ